MKTSSLITLLSLAALPLLSTNSAEAKTFRNAYVSFDLTERWDCTLEQTEWVCRTGVGAGDNREAIIILTAKEVGPADSLMAYQQHLKTPRMVPSRTGQPIQSQILKVEQRTINQQPWIDGMHLASEIPNYYTRYLATTKDKIAVLVTFSAHKTHYSKYSSDFYKAIESLRVIATKSLMGGGGGGGVGIPGSDMLGSGNTGLGGMGMGDELPEEGSGGKGGDATTKAVMALAVLALLGGLYLVLKKKKKKPVKRK
jgi:LPXTG-motif cell wall-anchored protein